MIIAWILTLHIEMNGRVYNIERSYKAHSECMKSLTKQEKSGHIGICTPRLRILL